MTTYIARRLLQTLGLLFLLSILLFTLVNLAPGGPLSAYGGRRIRPERVELLKRRRQQARCLACHTVARATQSVGRDLPPQGT